MSTKATWKSAELLRWSDIVAAAESQAINKGREAARSSAVPGSRLRWDRPPAILVAASVCAEWLLMDGRAHLAAGSAVIECAPLARQFTSPTPQHAEAVTEAFTVAYLAYLTQHGAPAGLLGLAEPDVGKPGRAIA